jgi:hypothetical protein
VRYNNAPGEVSKTASIRGIILRKPSVLSSKNMRKLTSTAKKIMEVYRYLRIKRDEYISLKLLQSKKHLWKDIEEEEFNQAVDDLIKMGYIGRIENPVGWKLLEAGHDYLNQGSLPF